MHNDFNQCMCVMNSSNLRDLSMLMDYYAYLIDKLILLRSYQDVSVVQNTRANLRLRRTRVVGACSLIWSWHNVLPLPNLKEQPMYAIREAHHISRRPTRTQHVPLHSSISPWLPPPQLPDQSPFPHEKHVAMTTKEFKFQNFKLMLWVTYTRMHYLSVSIHPGIGKLSHFRIPGNPRNQRKLILDGMWNCLGKHIYATHTCTWNQMLLKIPIGTCRTRR